MITMSTQLANSPVKHSLLFANNKKLLCEVNVRIHPFYRTPHCMMVN